MNNRRILRVEVKELGRIQIKEMMSRVYKEVNLDEMVKDWMRYKDGVKQWRKIREGVSEA